MPSRRAVRVSVPSTLDALFTAYARNWLFRAVDAWYGPVCVKRESDREKAEAELSMLLRLKYTFLQVALTTHFVIFL
jgi:hypothetical protein